MINFFMDPVQVPFVILLVSGIYVGLIGSRRLVFIYIGILLMVAFATFMID